eukprot:TRINITY_DN68744_c0_g1_i1.p1 TRINITY_DN68744_c0_g1~~TRINITY_DN68744_c0_g1_i1.p1  ORF type:complete len:1160 (+),score=132.83 TRINITY_DN68744_c0_g1_i1:101-3580(+)
MASRFHGSTVLLREFMFAVFVAMPVRPSVGLLYSIDGTFLDTLGAPSQLAVEPLVASESQEKSPIQLAHKRKTTDKLANEPSGELKSHDKSKSHRELPTKFSDELRLHEPLTQSSGALKFSGNEMKDLFDWLKSDAELPSAPSGELKPRHEQTKLLKEFKLHDESTTLSDTMKSHDEQLFKFLQRQISRGSPSSKFTDKPESNGDSPPTLSQRLTTHKPPIKLSDDPKVLASGASKLSELLKSHDERPSKPSDGLKSHELSIKPTNVSAELESRDKLAKPLEESKEHLKSALDYFRLLLTARDSRSTKLPTSHEKLQMTHSSDLKSHDKHADAPSDDVKSQGNLPTLPSDGTKSRGEPPTSHEKPPTTRSNEPKSHDKPPLAPSNQLKPLDRKPTSPSDGAKTRGERSGISDELVSRESLNQPLDELKAHNKSMKQLSGSPPSKPSDEGTEGLEFRKTRPMEELRTHDKPQTTSSPESESHGKSRASSSNESTLLDKPAFMLSGGSSNESQNKSMLKGEMETARGSDEVLSHNTSSVTSPGLSSDGLRSSDAEDESPLSLAKIAEALQLQPWYMRVSTFPFPELFATHVTPESFFEIVNQPRGYDFVLLEFFMPWCPHCQHFAPELERIAIAAQALHHHHSGGGMHSLLQVVDEHDEDVDEVEAVGAPRPKQGGARRHSPPKKGAAKHKGAPKIVEKQEARTASAAEPADEADTASTALASESESVGHHDSGVVRQPSFPFPGNPLAIVPNGPAYFANPLHAPFPNMPGPPPSLPNSPAHIPPPFLPLFPQHAATPPPTLLIASIDCQTYFAFCEQFKILSFPSLMFAPPQAWTQMNSQNIVRFTGDERTPEAIGKWIAGMVPPLDITPFIPERKMIMQLYKATSQAMGHANGEQNLPIVHATHVDLWDIKVTTALLIHSIIAEFYEARDPQSEIGQAFANFVDVLHRRFPDDAPQNHHPFSPTCKQSFGTLREIVAMVQSDGMHLLNGISWDTPEHFENAWSLCGEEWNDFATRGWVSCRGTWPGKRGFTCGLWNLMHVLFAGPEDEYALYDLIVVRETIRLFFACQDCRDHFLAMPWDPTTILSRRDAMLWLWRTHNLVNTRVLKIETELDDGDPAFVKTQWPTADLCPRCTVNLQGMMVWNEDVVAVFLQRFYTVY